MRRRAYGLASFLFLEVASSDHFGGGRSFSFSVMNLFMSVAAFIVAPLDKDRTVPIAATVRRHGEI